METAMVKTLASLPRARALVTTLGARGSVMIRRVDDWGGGAGEKEREGDAPKTTTLKELLAALESGVKRGIPSPKQTPVPSPPLTSKAAYLIDAG